MKIQLLTVNPNKVKFSYDYHVSDAFNTPEAEQLLRESINEVGIQYPIVVIKIEENHFSVYQGKKRLEAVLEMKISKLPLIVMS